MVSIAPLAWLHGSAVGLALLLTVNKTMAWELDNHDHDHDNYGWDLMRPPLFLLPDVFQRLAKLPLAQGSCQFPFPEDAADPPDLQTSEGKGNQTQLEVSPVQLLHFASSFARAQIRSKVCLN